MRTVLLILSVASLLYLFSPVGKAIQDKSLVIYLPLEEGNGNVIKDQSGNGFEGKVVGAKWVDGKFGKALQFNGQDDYAEVVGKIIDSVEKTQQITIEAWFNLITHADYDGIVAIEWPQGDCCEYRTMVNPGFNPFWNAGHHVDRSLSNFTFKTGTWYHYVLTYDGERGNIYVDGKLIGGVDENFKLPLYTPVAVQLAVGPLPFHYTNGIIDEAAVYNRALTETEINQDKDNGVMPTAVSLLDKLTTTWAKIKSH